MGTVDLSLARSLQRDLGLCRAVETGTYMGTTARALAGIFPAVVTIELSAQLHREAAAALADLRNVRLLQGHSVERLPELADEGTSTLFFLDGHWSGGETAGAEDECPVLQEIAAIGSGHPLDCLVIDDANLFTSPPPPPHLPASWPTLVQVLDAIRTERPGHHVTLLDHQVIAVPQEARALVDSYGQSLLPADGRWQERVRRLIPVRLP